jgi:hypothetical protein
MLMPRAASGNRAAERGLSTLALPIFRGFFLAGGRREASALVRFALVGDDARLFGAFPFAGEDPGALRLFLR